MYLFMYLFYIFYPKMIAGSVVMTSRFFVGDIFQKIIYFMLIQVAGWYLVWQPLPLVCEWVNVRHSL